MKRPLAVIGFAFLASLVVAVFLGPQAFGLLFSVCLLSFALFMKSKRTRKRPVLPLAAAAALAAVVSISAYTAFRITPAEDFKGKTVQMNAVLQELPYEQYDHYVYPMTADELTAPGGDTLHNVKVLVRSSHLYRMEPCDRMTAGIKLDKNVRLSDLSKGTVLTGYIADIKQAKITPAEERSLWYYPLAVRKFMSEKISALLPEKQSSFVAAFLTGDKSCVSPDVKEELRESGLSHIIVVSGFHLSVLTQLMLMLLGLLMPRKRRLAPILCGIAVLFYMAVTGFSPSVTRAGVMQLTMLTALALSKRADPINSLGLAVLILTIADPYAAADVSLLLSFSATLGILAVSPSISLFIKERIAPYAGNAENTKGRSLRRFLRFMTDVFSVALSAYLFTLPVLVLYFRRIPLWSVLSNMLTAPVIPVMIGAAALMLICELTVVLSFLTPLLSIITGLTVNYVLGVAGWTASLPYSTVSAGRAFVPWWIFFVGVLCLFLLLFRRKRGRVRLLALTAAFAFISGTAVTDLWNYGAARLVVFDTGSGLSVLMIKDDTAAVLSCGGGSGTSGVITSYLEAVGADDIDLLLLTGNDKRSCAYAHRILSDNKVLGAQVYGEEELDEAVHSGLADVDELILHPAADTEPNHVIINGITVSTYVTDSCRAIHTEINGSTVLICQDNTDIAALPREWKSCDLLIRTGTLIHPEQLRCGIQILSDSAGAKSGDTAHIGKTAPVCTCDEGDITVRIYPDKHTEIRSEGLWPG